MNSNSNKIITINQHIKDLTDGPLDVNCKETTDGVPFYECSIKGQKIQLRKNEQWELIWGELPQEQVAQLGKLLDDEITNA